MTTLPVIVRIESDNPVAVSRRIHVTKATLTRAGDDEFFLGFTTSITSRHKEKLIIDKDHPFVVNIDVLSEDSELEEFIKGNYLVNIEVTVFKSEEDGFFPEAISGELPIEIR
jgi:hypothetical protein